MLDTSAGSTDTFLTISDIDPVTLNGAGTILMANALDHITSANSGTSLTINGNTILGVGSIGDSFTDITIDKGIIAASGGELDISANSFHNAGTLEATGGGTLHLSAGIDISNTSNSALIETLSANSHIELDGAFIGLGKVSIFKGSTLETVGSTGESIISAPVSNAGTIANSTQNLQINGPVNNSGVLDANAHVLNIQGVVSGMGTATVEHGGTLEFGLASSAKVTFDGSANDTLVVDAATSVANKFTGTIANFNSNDEIDLVALNYVNGDAQITSYKANATGGVLTVHDATHSESLTFVGHAYTLLQATDFHILNVSTHIAVHTDFALV